jgi:hypothetical protein
MPNVAGRLLSVGKSRSSIQSRCPKSTNDGRRTADPARLKAAAEESYRNHQIMKDAGLSPIPVIQAPLSFVYAIDAEAEPVKNHHRVARRRAMIAIISYEIDYNAAAPINFPISH